SADHGKSAVRQGPHRVHRTLGRRDRVREKTVRARNEAFETALPDDLAVGIETREPGVLAIHATQEVTGSPGSSVRQSQDTESILRGNFPGAIVDERYAGRRVAQLVDVEQPFADIETDEGAAVCRGEESESVVIERKWNFALDADAEARLRIEGESDDVARRRRTVEGTAKRRGQELHARLAGQVTYQADRVEDRKCQCAEQVTARGGEKVEMRSKFRV